MRNTFVCLAVFIIGMSGLAQEKPNVQFLKVPSPKSVREVLSKSLNQNAVRVTFGTQVATIWLRGEWPVKPKALLSLTHDSIRPGAFVGLVQFEQPWLDFRGQELPACVYSLRYSRQPKSADHEDTSPSVDFLLLSPVGEEKSLDDVPFAELKKRSGKSTGGTHPASMVLLPVTKRDDGLFWPKESWVGLQWKWKTEIGEGKLAAVIFGVWNGK